MSQILGLTLAGIQEGLDTVLIQPKRGIGNFSAQVTIEEEHVDEMTITDHPVEIGSRISDHAFLQPAELVIKCGWSDSPSNVGLLKGLVGAYDQTIAGVNAITDQFNSSMRSKDFYEGLRKLQALREPFTVWTGKREYSNMLIKSIRTTTNKETENSFIATIALRQVMLTTTQTVILEAPVADQLYREITQSKVQKGAKSLVAGKNANTNAVVKALNP